MDTVKHNLANLWNKAQAQFIKESRDDDADWAGMVDELDTRLRE